MSKKFNFNI